MFIKIINAIPIVGNSVAGVFLGGEFINALTYSRVAVLHVSVKLKTKNQKPKTGVPTRARMPGLWLGRAKKRPENEFGPAGGGAAAGADSRGALFFPGGQPFCEKRRARGGVPRAGQRAAPRNPAVRAKNRLPASACWGASNRA